MNWKLNEKNVINRAEMILCDGKISKLNQGAFAGFMTETDAHNVLSSSLIYKVTWHLYTACASFFGPITYDMCTLMFQC